MSFGHQRTDPSQNFIARHSQPLDAVFLPKSIAVVGAKDTVGSVGRTIFLNLTSSYKGQVFPVNPKRQVVLGHVCYPDVSQIPQKVDLAVIVTPASTVPKVMQECVDAGVKAAIVISAGFKELGEGGLKLEQEILKIAKGKIRIIGPNCLGVMNPITGMNATFAKGIALPGHIAFISQSGAMCTAVLDWSFQERIGFSSFVSIGSMADVDWGDLISYLGGDPETQSILIYMETIGNPRTFLSAAREIALEKPIIVIKPGRTQAAAQAAASHTGSLAGSDDVFNAALERVGVLRVDTIGELFSMASVLSRQPRPRGPRLAIVTNAGGPSVLATDATVLHGAEIAKLDQTTVEQLNTFLPSAWSHTNPVDILGDAGPEQYAKTVEIVSKDPHVDGLLVILSPQDVTDPIKSADCLRPFAHLPSKPILASWMGGSSVKKGIELLSHAQIPCFEYPDDAANTFATMWSYAKNLKSLYETPTIREDSLDDTANICKTKQAQKLIEEVRREGRELLDEYESKQILQLYDIPTVRTEKAISVEQAVKWAEEIGFPVVLKLFSRTITHKSDVGGVKLNLRREEDVIKAFFEIKEAVDPSDFQGVTVQQMIKPDGYEIILGSSVDPQFGPVLLFGMGGQLVEVFKDSALALPPLNSNLASKLMEKTKIFDALKGVRGKKGVDMLKLESTLVRFSEFIVENRWIKECDINPLFVSEKGMIALDARILLFSSSMKESELPRLSIRPYPINYMKNITLKNGTQVTLRPIRPEDEELMIRYHKDLSENSVRQRFFEFISLSDRVAHERLVRICFNDFDREIAIVAEIKTPQREIIGFGRLSRFPGTDDAQMTMLIRDGWHNLGLGSQILKHLLAIAKQEGIGKIFAKILSENDGMIAICQKEGFQIEADDVFTYATKSMNFTKVID